MDDSAKIKFLTYTPTVTASLSLVGSSLTLLTIHRTEKQKRKTYHRLMLGISVFDIIMSTGLALGPLPVPADTGLPGAHGNTATCTFQAMLLQLGTASIPYSVMLMVYFVLVIRYGLNNFTMLRVEPILHLIPILYHLAIAVGGIAPQVYNSQGTLCWIAASPLGCTDDPTVDCERGEEYEELFGLWLLVIPLMIWNFLMMLALLIVAITVIRRYRKSNRFVFEGSSRSAFAKNQTKQVIAQCLLYAVTFVNMLFWGTLGTILHLAEAQRIYEKNFWMPCLSVIFVSIQGLFNFLIFIRPRYLTKREQHCEAGRWFALRQAIWNPTSSDSGSSSMKTEPESHMKTEPKSKQHLKIEHTEVQEGPPEASEP